MSNFDSDGSPEQEWDDRGELVWNEFDWERYLRAQDEAINRYLRLYEACDTETDRIDAVAQEMGWGQPEDAGDAAHESEDIGTAEDEVYTLHKNPIFVATKAISLGLRRSWEARAAHDQTIPQALGVALLSSLHHTEDQAVQAIHALDYGDYAMAVSLFKRALSSLNRSLALLNEDAAVTNAAVAAWRENAQPKLFDLREIWLRVIAECRDELERPAEDGN